MEIYSVKVLGIDKLDVNGGCTLYLYDVLYSLRVWRNLFSITNMLSLGFVFKFDGHGVNIYLESTYYGCGYIYVGLIILDFDYSHRSNGNDYLFYFILSC